MRQTVRQILEQEQEKENLDQHEVAIILAHVLQKKREYLIAHDTEPISHAAAIRTNRLILKRKKGVPIAYITGYKEFYGLDFIVNKYTLIPRPETELVVDLVSKKINNLAPHAMDIYLIDVGTGTGCIPIAVRKHTNKHMSVYGADISWRALRVAKKNAKKHAVDISFLRGNLLMPMRERISMREKKNTARICITANLPYLTEKQWMTKKEIHYEPKRALVPRYHSLALYDELLKQIKKNFQGVFPIFCYFEIDPSQSETLKNHIGHYFPTAKIIIHRDLKGNNRVVECAIIPHNHSY